MAKTTKRRASKADPTPVETYRHPEATSLLRPDVGTQAQFRKKKPPQTYRYDSSLSPALDWDGGNGARELGEWLVRCIAQAAQIPPPHTFPEAQTFKDGRGNVVATVRNLQEAVEQLQRLSRPFLNWTGKAERLSFDVPTLPLFIHERLSTQAILETLKGHKRDKQMSLLDLFGDPQHSVSDQVLRAYEHANGWTNRLILGDSLMVMNSLLHYEGMGGQVQMIYMDPPYGVKFGSNFQPFVRKRDVTHNDDEDMTREPEMVKAYRDTWELGLHSYLTYMRDRLYLAHDLLHPNGSIFVQISDENLHHVRELMDEVFEAENFVAVIPFRKKTMPLGAKYLEGMCDYLLWYAREFEQIRYHQLYKEQDIEGEIHWTWYELSDGTRHRMTAEQRSNHKLLSEGARVFRLVSMWPPTFSASAVFPVTFRGKTYTPPPGQCWPTGSDGMQKLVDSNRLEPEGNHLRYVLYHDDYRLTKLTNLWGDMIGARDQSYVVQTNTKVIERCLLMTTDPGDLVLDPTCVRKGTRVLAPPLSPRERGDEPPLWSPRERGDEPPLWSPRERGDLDLPAGQEGMNSLPVHGGQGARPHGSDRLGGGRGGGSIPIESLTPGCFVYGHDGQPNRVVRVIEKPYQGLMVGLRHAENREMLWLTADHLVLAKIRPRSLGGHRDWSASPTSHIAARKELRREMTPPERKLWSLLQNSQLGFKFRRQHPIGPYIADFYSRETHLVVEVDGSSHFEPDAIEYDLKRDAYMRSLGLDMLRFTAREVETNPEGVCLAIQSQCQIRTHSTEGAEWVQAGSLQPGDFVFMPPLWSPRERGDVSGSSPIDGETMTPSPFTGRVGVGVIPVELKEVRTEWSEEIVYDLEVEGAHSFMTEVCAVHNCGSGTTAYVAEQWGRRWISTDISRVPLALARQRLLTATFSYYELKDEKRGPAGGFVYRRKQNNKGEEVGGIVPHVTLKSIANDEPPEEEVLVDRPEEVGKITRVTGPFTVEATIPTPVDWEGDGEEDSGTDDETHGSFVDRMLEVLRKSPVLHVGGGKTVTLSNVRPPAKTLSLSAEALVDVTAPGQRPTLQEAVQEAEEKRGQALPLSKKPVAIVFGPENGAVSEKLVYEAAREAYAKSYTHLYVIGFAIQSNARELVEQCEAAVGVSATYVQATPDLMMGDLLKNMRSSQIFSVCGLPEVRIRKVHPKHEGEPVTYQAELLGLDLFDPATMEAEHRKGDDVPAWLLDTDYNNLCFHAGQVFFPRTSAWDALKRALRGTHEDTVWDHLSGTVSAPFEAGEHGQVAVKVIDDRGNELLVVKSLKEAEG